MTTRRGPDLSGGEADFEEEPELHWTDYGTPLGKTLTEFPPLSSFVTRSAMLAGHLDAETYERQVHFFALSEFVDCVSKATERVLVVDPYFGKLEAEDRSTALTILELGLKSSRVKVVKLASGKLERGHFAKMMERLESARNGGEHAREPGEIQWRDRLRQNHGFDAHDRFAVIDDEFWHFGSDVGGAHRGITLSSRGWSATRRGGGRFFDELWQRLGD